MVTEVIMPRLSLSMRTGVVLRWYKPVGSLVERGEPLCEIEADKAVTDIQAPESGYLLRIIARESEEFPVREVIAYIGAKDARPQEAAVPGDSPAPTPATGITSPPSQLAAHVPPAAGNTPDERAQALPVAREPVSERMIAGHPWIPRIGLSLSADMRAALRLCDRTSLSPGGLHITVTDLVIWAAARVLPQHRSLNSSYTGESMRMYPEINVGVTAEGDLGPVVPVIHRADELSLIEIAAQRHELVERARSGKPNPEDVSGRTFTVSDLGMYAPDIFSPVIAPGQSATLAVGRIFHRPTADESGRIEVRPVAYLTVVCDPRVVSEADGAGFLSDLVSLLGRLGGGLDSGVMAPG